MLTKPSPQVTDLVNFLKGELGIAEATSVEVTFVNENVMTELHMRYMGLPGPTDVLSFPATDVAYGPVDPQGLQDEPTLGDIVICPAFIESNSRSGPTQMNINACVIHGMLHLVGFGHESIVMRSQMLNKEQELEQAWHLLHDHTKANPTKVDRTRTRIGTCMVPS
jgi:probable rRNA maturation factor